VHSQKYPVYYWDGHEGMAGIWDLVPAGKALPLDHDGHRIAAWASQTVPDELPIGTVRVFVDPHLSIDTVKALLKKIANDMTGSWVKVTQGFPTDAKRALTFRQGDDHVTRIID
jgi:hypothetical protein